MPQTIRHAAHLLRPATFSISASRSRRTPRGARRDPSDSALRMGCRMAIGALCVGVVMLAPACGGGKDDTSAKAEAEHRFNALRLATDDDATREGEWTRSGDILTAWVLVTPTEGKPYARCVSVDISQRIDNEADLGLAVTVVSDEGCEGTKPTP